MEPFHDDPVPDLPLSDSEGGAPDPGLQEATDALLSQMGGEPAEKPEAAPAGAPPAAPPAPKPPGRLDSYKGYQGGYAKRQAQARAENQRRREEVRRYETQIVEQNKLMQQTIELLKKERGGAEVQEAPDALDPAFPQWLQEQLRTHTSEQLKPVLEHLQAQQQERESLQQEQAEVQRREAVASEITSTYQSYQQEYEEQAPELAAGFADRFQTSRGLIAQAFEIGNGAAPDEAQQLTDMWILAIGRRAEAAGENPVAAVDGFFTALAGLYGYEPEGLPAAFQAPPPPPPRQSETARMAAVQQRTRTAASAAPRVASRAEQPKSEMMELYNGGVRDHKALHRAALRDAHGDMRAASAALQELAAQA
jgi:hypothetical protein